MDIDARVLPIAYLNGEFLPVQDANISVLDRGFLFGDAIYEVVPVFDGRLFRAESHIERLQQGLAAIGINSGFDKQDWIELFRTLIKRNDNVDMSIYLQVSRGRSRFRDHAPPDDLKPTVFAMAQKLAPRAPGIGESGLRAILLADTRWALCRIKATSLLANVLLKKEAMNSGAFEAILHRDGMVTEAASSTIMIVLDNTLICPPPDDAILPGTTRTLAEELALTCKIPTQVRLFSVTEMLGADEVILSAATKHVLPICQIDDTTIGDGSPGPVWRMLDVAFAQYLQSLPRV